MRHRRTTAMAALLIGGLTATPALAHDWTGAAGDGLATTAGNWQNDDVPGAGTGHVNIIEGLFDPLSPFAIDLDGTVLDVGHHGLTIEGEAGDPDRQPYLFGGAVELGLYGLLDVSHATIDGQLTPDSGNRMGDVTFLGARYINGSGAALRFQAVTGVFDDSLVQTSQTVTVRASGGTAGHLSFIGLWPDAAPDEQHRLGHVHLGEGSGGAGTGMRLDDTRLEVTGSIRIGKQGQGELDLIASTLIARRHVILHPTGRLMADAGIIDWRPAGADLFDIEQTDPAHFDGEGLTLAVSPTGNGSAHIEVAGRDTGLPPAGTPGGFDGNYSLDLLTLDGTVFLIDAVDNSPADAQAEALYVDTVRIVGPTTLDLGGLSLYTRTLVIEEGASLIERSGAVRAEVRTDLNPIVSDPITPGVAFLEPATFNSLGVVWPMSGDPERDAVVAVRFRACVDAPHDPAGCTAWGGWQDGPSLHRTDGEYVAADSKHPWTAPNRFAGSIMGLEPATWHRIELTLTDPGGVEPAGTPTTIYLDALTRAPVTVTGNPTARVFPAADPAADYVGGAGLATAYAAAAPGAIIELEPGVYTAPAGGYLMPTQAAAGQPITIRKRPGAVGEVIIDGNGTGTLLDLRDGAHHVFEDLTLRNAMTLAWLGFSPAGQTSRWATDMTFRRIVFDSSDPGPAIGNQLWGLQCRSTGCRNIHVVDSEFVGHKVSWRFADTPTRFAPASTGLIVGGRGHVIERNRFRGYRDGLALWRPIPLPVDHASETTAIDIHDNDIGECDDDAAQLDFGFANVRFLRNYVHRSMIGISFQPVYGGPIYVHRNVVYDITRFALKTHAWPAGLRVTNNTFVTVQHPTRFGAYWQTSHFVNNLFIGTETTEAIVSTGTPMPGWSSFEHNAVHAAGTTYTPAFEWFEHELPHPATMPVDLATGAEKFPTLTAWSIDLGFGGGDLEGDMVAELGAVPLPIAGDGRDYHPDRCPEDGQICVAATCQFRACAAARDCLAGMTCDAGACVPHGECDASNPCDVGRTCVDAVCRTPCTVDADCVQGEACAADGTCGDARHVDPDDLVADCATDADCPAGERCLDDPFGQAAGTMRCAVRERCAADTDCAAGAVCYQGRCGAAADFVVDGAGWAPAAVDGTLACTADCNCPLGLTCQPAAGGGSACARPPLTVAEPTPFAASPGLDVIPVAGSPLLDSGAVLPGLTPAGVETPAIGAYDPALPLPVHGPLP